MSWQAYVDDQLLATGKVTKAALVGQQGGVWAASAGYKLAADEEKSIVGLAKDPSSAFAGGIRVGGEKFITTGASPAEIMGRKGGRPELMTQEKGIVIVPTKQAIIVAEYDQPIVAGDCNVVVNKLGDYLKSVGY